MIFNDTGKRGLDVSYYQDDNNTPQQIDFAQMKAWGADFVIIRAGQNVWVDPDFVSNWRRAREAGIPRAAYWFLDPRISPYEQARIFSELFKDDKPEGRLWVDLEYPASWGGSFASWRQWKIFIEEVKRRTGLRVGIYTADWWWQPNAVGQGADLFYFGDYPLWVAQYTADPQYVKLPKGWTIAMLWQDGTPAIGHLVGVESLEVDHNKWNSDFDFITEWGLTDTLPPYDGGNTMLYEGNAKHTATPNVRIRKGFADNTPNPTGMTIGAIMPGQPFKGDSVDAVLNGDLWMHVTEAGGKAIDGWSAAWLLDYAEVVVTPPPPVTDAHPVYGFVRWSDGSEWETTTFTKKAG